jgi:hypothetical protein
VGAVAPKTKQINKNKTAGYMAHTGKRKGA